MQLLAAIGLGTVLASAVSIAAARSETCSDFSERKSANRSAPDVFVVVERTGMQPACFLVPREVTAHELREFYRDGRRFTLAFQGEDLERYLRGKESVMVGKERRAVSAAVRDCLKTPAPLSLAVMNAGEFPLDTLAAIRKRGGYELKADIAGYHRYGALADDYYFRDVSGDAEPSFLCHIEHDKPVCVIVDRYDGLRLGAKQPKEAMSRIDPDTTRQCLRAIVHLFQVPYGASAQP